MSRPVDRAVVVGAGTMGHGIAQVAAQAGCRVTLYDVNDDALAAGLSRIRKNLKKGVSLGKLEPGVRDSTLARLETSSDLEDAVADADLVVEAAPEALELKRKLFRAIEHAAPPDALLASNTSSLSISRIAEVLGAPARFLGLHFFNPVHIMKLVEVVRGEKTTEPSVEQAVSFARRIGKEPIVVRDSPGFASSRLGIALGLEAMRMVEEGVASAEDIDKAMELGYRHPMGPLRLTDLVGLDVRLDIAEYLYEELESETFRPPGILRNLVSRGHLGQKTGRGFYEWRES